LFSVKKAFQKTKAVFTVSNSGKQLMSSLNIATPDKLLTVEICHPEPFPNTKGCHVLIKMDEFRNQGDVEGFHVGNYSCFDNFGELDKRLPLFGSHQANIAEEEMNLDRQSTSTVITVMFYYTSDFESVTSNPTTFF
jgi:hypothetical protein